MPKSDFLIAITQLAAERNLSQEVVLEAVEAALVSAFKKDMLAEADLSVKFGNQGEVHVYSRLTVVDPVLDPSKEVSVTGAQARKPTAKVGDVIDLEVTPSNAGRIAAQTAKQVVIQRLRDAERDLIYAEYADKEGQVLSGTVQRLEGRSVIIDLGRAEAVLPPQEQSPTEHYRNGQRLKVYVLEVGKTPKGPQVVVSRTHKDLLRRLFELEVPEIYSCVVEIKSIAREPGFRSKVAVSASQERVDPVGACVGLRGMRIQNIVNELHGEKIDVVEWVPDHGAFISKALGPAQVLNVYLRRTDGIATVVVPDRQLSLAIGREGQNARLAAKLTAWRIDIKSATEAEVDKDRLASEHAAQEQADKDLKAQQATLVAASAALIAKPMAVPALARPVGAPQPVLAQATATATPMTVTQPKTEVLKAQPPRLSQPGGGFAPEQPAMAGPGQPVTARPAKPTPTPPAWKQPEPELAVEEEEPEEEQTKAVPMAQALTSEETWRVVQPPPSRSAIRFAEDIAEFRGRRAPGRKGDKEEARGAKRKGGSRR